MTEDLFFPDITIKKKKIKKKKRVRVIPDTCPFCDLKRITIWHFVGVGFKIVKCATCMDPLIVYDAHTAKPDPVIMCNAYMKAIDLFGSDIGVDRHMDMWSSHAHAHITQKKVIKVMPGSIKRRDRGQIVKVTDRGKTIRWRQR